MEENTENQALTPEQLFAVADRRSDELLAAFKQSFQEFRRFERSELAKQYKAELKKAVDASNEIVNKVAEEASALGDSLTLLRKTHPDVILPERLIEKLLRLERILLSKLTGTNLCSAQDCQEMTSDDTN